MRTNTRRRSPGFDITSSFAAGSEGNRADHLKGLTDRLESAARLASSGDVAQPAVQDEERSVVTSLHKTREAEAPVDQVEERPEPQARAPEPARRAAKPAAPATPNRKSRISEWNRRAELPAQGTGLGLGEEQIRLIQQTIHLRPDQIGLVKQIAAIEALRNNSNITFTQALRVIIDLGLSQVSEHYAAEEERLG